jgi:hypothetical protein
MRLLSQQIYLNLKCSWWLAKRFCDFILEFAENVILCYVNVIWDREDDRILGVEEEGPGEGGDAGAAPVQPQAPPPAEFDGDGVRIEQQPVIAQAPPIVQQTWAAWSGSLVRKVYGEAAIAVTKGHSDKHHMVMSMSAFIADLAVEVERVGGLRKKGVARHNADAMNPSVPQPTEQILFDALPEIGPSINYERIIQSHSNKYTKSTYGWAPYDGLMTRTPAPLAWVGDARTLNDLVEECFPLANASTALNGMSDLVSRAWEYGFSKATWNHVFMKVASTAFQDQADIVNMQAAGWSQGQAEDHPYIFGLLEGE